MRHWRTSREEATQPIANGAGTVAAQIAPDFEARRADLTWASLFFCHIEQCGEDFGRSFNAYEAANKVTRARFPLFSRKTVLHDRTPEGFSDNVEFKSGNEICRALAHCFLPAELGEST